MAAAKKKPCASVSTLRAMAENFRDTQCIVCAVMDARCNQGYNALFDCSKGVVTRITEDRALLCQELKEELETVLGNTQKSVIIAGDGTDVFYPFVKDLEGVSKSDIQRMYQNAIGVGLTSLDYFEKGETLSPEKLLPIYLRLPQAERELKNKRSEEK